MALEERNEAINLILTMARDLLDLSFFTYWNRKAVFKGIKKLCKKLPAFKIDIKLDLDYKLLREDSDFLKLSNCTVLP